VDCSTSTLLRRHFAPTKCSSGSLQQFARRHSPRSSFFSVFEDPLLRITGTMESHGVRKLYEPSPVPTLYVGEVEDILGRVPLFPCFLDGNITSTIPYKYAARQTRDFAFGCADGPLQGSRRGSHVYDVAETEQIRKWCGRGEAARGAWKTRRARKRAAAEAQIADDI
jgi:hypothetical protein